MMWGDIFAALALLLVFEGLMPFLSPHNMRKNFARMAQMDDRTLRIAGLLSMVSGAILLMLVR